MMNATEARARMEKALADKEAKVMRYAENIAEWVCEVVIKYAVDEGKCRTCFTDSELHNHFSYLEMTGTNKALEMLKELGYEVEEEYTIKGNIYRLAW